MYVDESGDTGMCAPSGNSPSRYFCLTGLVVHELHWAETMNQIKQFRHWLRHKYGIYTDYEIHAADMISKPGRLAASLAKRPRYQRLAILRHHADQLARLPYIRLINVCVDKVQKKYTCPNDIFRKAWYVLFQRFENTMLKHNFPGPRNEHERGIIFPDNTDGLKLKQYLDRMRIHNPLYVRHHAGSSYEIDEPIRLIIEDPVCRDSRHSYFVQAVDTAVYLFKQHLMPNAYMKRTGAQAYFLRLYPVLCLHASNTDANGVVRL